MASGNSLHTFSVLGAELAGTNYPTFDTRNNHPLLNFDAATDETCYFTDVLSRAYGNGGVTVRAHLVAATATTGTARIEIAWERVTSLDVDGDSFATAKSASYTPNGTNGVPTEVSIAFTNGAEMDSVVAGDCFRLLFRRDANGTTGTDDMANDLQLLGIEIRET